MTVLLTPLITENKAELAFARLLEGQLSHEYLCWHEVPIKSSARKRVRFPDFILFNPKYGVWVLEVKEWSLSYIKEHNSKQFTVGPREERVDNPYHQARFQAFALKDLLKEKSALMRNGRFMVPIMWGTVLYNITRQEFEAPEKTYPFSKPGRLGDIPSHGALCADELQAESPGRALEQRLLSMFEAEYAAHEPFPEKIVATIRDAIFPDIRIVADTTVRKPGIASDVKLIDLEQEKVLRRLDAGSHILFGVAGSGKTILLLNKARELLEQESGDKPSVLYLCRGTAVADQIRRQANQIGLPPDTVYSFHKWCSHLLRPQGISLPSSPSQLPTRLIEEIARGKAVPEKYDAILLDEGHDFKDRPEWLTLIVSMRRSATSLLVMAYDEAQAIYQGKPFPFSLEFLGKTAAIKKHILRKNYRNTEQILLFAKVFANALLEDAEQQEIPKVRPIGCGAAGKLPLVLACSSFGEELQKTAEAIQSAHRLGRSWSDIAVLFHTYDFNKLEGFAERIESVLRQKGIPCSREESEFTKDRVKVMSITKAKGLGFGLVCIVGASWTEYSLASRENDERKWREYLKEDTHYLYNAMTRALEELVITYTIPQERTLAHRRVIRLDTALGKVRGT